MKELSTVLRAVLDSVEAKRAAIVEDDEPPMMAPGPAWPPGPMECRSPDPPSAPGEPSGRVSDGEGSSP